MRSRDVIFRRLTRWRMVVVVAIATLVGVSAASDGATVRASQQLRRVTTVALVGHGWGPGVGMGQWGAFGYAARYHFGYERILNRYYGGTSAATLPSIGAVANPTISVVIEENLNLSTNLGFDPIVTSGVPFTVTSAGGTPTTTSTSTSTPTTSTPTTPTSPSTVPSTTTPGLSFSVPAGTAIDLRLAANGTWNAYEGSTCAAASVATGAAPVATGLVNPILAPTAGPTAPSTQLLVLCRHDGVDETLRGSIQAYDRSGYERTLNLVPLESYLQGVVPSESSASWGNDGGSVGAPQGQAWGFQALEAQAVAARSYALAYAAGGGWNGYANICDTTACQVYTGTNYETALTNTAVADTSAEVRVRPSAPSAIVLTQYSASTGGYTAPSTFGVVQDLGDACVAPGVSLECNPNHTWQVTVNGSTVMQHYPTIGRLLTVHVATRSGTGAYGGRVSVVVLHGKKATLKVAGAAFSAALGLKSNWFAIGRVTRAGESIPAASTTTPTAPGTSTTVPAPTTTTTPPTTSLPATTPAPTTPAPTTPAPTSTGPVTSTSSTTVNTIVP